MNYISYRNTQAVMIKLKKDLDRAAYIIDLTLQIVFIGYYLFLAISWVSDLLRHVIFASFFLMAVAYLVFHLVTDKKKDKKIRKQVKDIYRYVKYPIRALLIALSIYTIVTTEASDITKITVLLSIIAYFGQIIAQLVIRFTKKYANLIMQAAKMDYEDSDLIKAVVNAKLYPKQKERSKIAATIMDKGKEMVNNFINDNKDSAPIKEISDKEAKLICEVEEIKKKYSPLPEPQIVEEEEIIEETENELPLEEPHKSNESIMNELIQTGKKSLIKSLFTKKKNKDN